MRNRIVSLTRFRTVTKRRDKRRAEHAAKCTYSASLKHKMACNDGQRHTFVFDGHLSDCYGRTWQVIFLNSEIFFCDSEVFSCKHCDAHILVDYTHMQKTNYYVV